MKRIIFAVLTLTLLAVALSSRGGGRADDVKTTIGQSVLFNEEEINDAMDLVIRNFKREFDGCSLKSLSYMEDSSSGKNVHWARQYAEEEAIVLTSSFTVDSSGGDGSLNPNTRYDNWQWILTRSGGGKWSLQTWGY